MATRKLIGTDPDQVSLNGDLGTLAFQNSESVRLTNLVVDGNVGIGTSTPLAKLHINSGSSGGSIFQGSYGFSGDNYNIRLLNDGTSGYLSQVRNEGGIVVADGMKYYGSNFWLTDGTSTSSIQMLGGNTIFTNNAGLTAGSQFTPSERMRIDASGNVGIGTNAPAAKLDISAGNVFLTQDYEIQWKSGTATRAAIRGTSADSLNFYTRLGGTITEAMRIDTSTRVLIGTTTASGANLLQVNSDVLINGLTVGKGAGPVATNTVVGVNALVTNTTGPSNTAVGNASLRLNTTGGYNTAVGDNSLGANSTGGGNTAVGYINLFVNTTGNFNTSIGDGALTANITGSSNIAANLWCR